MSDDFEEAHKLALAFIKYRNGQIYLFDFKKHTGVSVAEAIEKYPWLRNCYEPKDIRRVYKDWHDS